MAINPVKAGLDGSTLQTSNVNGNHEVSENLAGAPQSKRKAYKLGESRSILIPGCHSIANIQVEWPIIIDGSDSEKPPKRQQRHRKIATPLKKRASDNAITMRELLRSSQKIVVISGAGLSTNAGCELDMIHD